MTGKRLTAERINELRKEAVRLRLEKKTLKEISDITGLTRPTISDAYKKFLGGGWAAVENRPRGAPRGTKVERSREGKRPSSGGSSQTGVVGGGTSSLTYPTHSAHSASAREERLWSLGRVEERLRSQGVSVSGRSVARYLERWGLTVSDAPTRAELTALLQHQGIDAGRRTLLSGSTRTFSGEQEGRTWSGYQIYAQDGRGRLFWATQNEPFRADDIAVFLEQLAALFPRSVLVFKSPTLNNHKALAPWLNGERPVTLVTTPHWQSGDSDPLPFTSHRAANEPASTFKRNPMALTHLQRLEAESIQIMREVVAETENPVMLYSVGKDSAVMLHLAMKAFSPSVPPFPLLHVDTTWKFQAMYKFRNEMAEKTGMKLLVHVNEEGRAQGINPFTHGSAIHTDIMKTEALKQALDKYGFDAAFGGARRDEEKSRAKERIFSFRTAQHRWDPKSQRPEIWKLYNARKHPKESIRVFPLSNWTELDIWQYIHLEQIPIVPLYYSAERPVVERDGTLIMVDDDRMPLNAGEVPMMKKVRFRTLGCYPLTGAVESEADTLPQIIQEMLLTNTSERQGRVIDHDSSASMEKKKQEGYF